MTADASLFSISVQETAIDLAQEINGLNDIDNMGALATFSGFVRHDDGVVKMEIEHYAKMTQTALENISQTAIERWNLQYVRIVHRYGTVAAKAPIVFVATAAAHRKEAFDACAYIMDFLKSRAPFWKKEYRHGNDLAAATACWVEAKEEDEARIAQWNNE